VGARRSFQKVKLKQMNLDKILAIGGKPGLYELVAQSSGGVIVESLQDGKRFPVSAAGNVSALKDIAIYTYAEEVPLKEVYTKIAEKEDYGKAPSHKESSNTLRAYLEEVLPDYDKERVYDSDIKKLFNWYNILQEKDLLKSEEGESESTPETVETKEAEQATDE
jgi:hypothetical protein